MKIVHLSRNDLQGGAARAAYRLHEGLRSIGHDSLMLVSSRTTDDPSVLCVERARGLVSRVLGGMRQYWIDSQFRQYCRSRPLGLELFSDDRSAYADNLTAQIPKCDVINLHWVPGLLDYEEFFSRLPRGMPVVWTLHDMNAFTGGCHYDLGCHRYLDGCGICPQLGSANKRDLSFRIWHRKRGALSRVDPFRLHIVSPSRWLAREAAKSPILGRFPVSVIPYGLNLKDYAPRNREAIRQLLNIPPQAKVVLFVAERMNNQRKGFAFLVEALNRCAANVPNLALLSIGQGKPRVDGSIPHFHIGSVDNDVFLSMVYSAADVFSVCSLQDNLPNTVLEALACGLPVVGVRVGGIPDMVRHGVNGLIVSSADAGALSIAISQLLVRPDKYVEMKAASRRIAIEQYPLELQARRYADLYQSLLTGSVFRATPSPMNGNSGAPNFEWSPSCIRETSSAL